MKLIIKPKDEEFQPNEPIYARLLPDDGRLLEHLPQNFKITSEFILSLPEDKLKYSYAPGKWTIKEVLMHVVDMERIYGYRALCFARNDKTNLPGFDDKGYAFFSDANERDIKSIMLEFETVRNATITLFNGLSEEALLRSGVANGHKASVRALAYHIGGHELYHINLIRERYF